MGLFKHLSILRVGFFKGYPKTVGFFYGGFFYDPCLHVSDSDLRHPTPDMRWQFFGSGRENRMTSEFRCMFTKKKLEKKPNMANRLLDVVSRVSRGFAVLVVSMLIWKIRDKNNRRFA